MAIRRMLMAMIGGGSELIGKLSQYELKSVVFESAGNDNNYISFPVSFDPKIIVFGGGTDTPGNIISGVFAFEYDAIDPVYAGAVRCRYTNNNIIIVGYKPEVRETTLPTPGAGKCYYYDGKIYLTRTSAYAWWSNTDTYTFEIYG